MQGPGAILEENGIELEDPVNGEQFQPHQDSPIIETERGFLLFSAGDTLAEYRAE